MFILFDIAKIFVFKFFQIYECVEKRQAMSRAGAKAEILRRFFGAWRGNFGFAENDRKSCFLSAI
ncbi:MAG TPA: hypothetical protein DHG49_00450 [Clostridiales bacterium]|nr:MAG: hypothetical protein DBY28_02700 [Subdoligranulum sp.]HCW81208.1 hypothetical protein [Clostridiales bacterium]